MPIKKFYLHGPLEGKTVVLGSDKYPFKDGVLEVEASDADLLQYAKFFKTNWNAEDHPPKKKRNRGVPARDEPDGVRPEPEKVAPVNKKLAKAVAALDHANPEHWTLEGLPSIEAVANLYGSADVTRKDIKAAAPNVVRVVVDEGND